MKTISFRDQDIAVEDARAMLRELHEALVKVDPVTSMQPSENEQLPLMIHPRWALYLQQPTALLPEGHLLTLRDVGLGWRAFLLPPSSAAELAAAITRQLGMLGDRTIQPPTGPGVTAAPAAANDAVVKH